MESMVVSRCKSKIVRYITVGTWLIDAKLEKLELKCTRKSGHSGLHKGCHPDYIKIEWNDEASKYVI